MFNKLFFVLLATLLASSPASGERATTRAGLLYGNAVTPNVARIMAQQMVRTARANERRAKLGRVPSATPQFSAEAIHAHAISQGLITADTPIEKNRPIWMERTRIKLENAQQVEDAYIRQQLGNLTPVMIKRIAPEALQANKETAQANKIEYIDPNGNVNTLYCRVSCTAGSLKLHEAISGQPMGLPISRVLKNIIKNIDVSAVSNEKQKIIKPVNGTSLKQIDAKIMSKKVVNKEISLGTLFEQPEADLDEKNDINLTRALSIPIEQVTKNKEAYTKIIESSHDNVNPLQLSCWWC